MRRWGVIGKREPSVRPVGDLSPHAPQPPPVRLHLFGHACLGIEAGGRRILTDPWLIGSCYWRSWWHFPGPPELPAAWRAPDVVYLSHHHFDHFHYPSMRTLDRSAVVHVPRFGVDMMRGELEGLGFEHVVEMPHGVVHDLGDGLRLASYQHGFDDSALVVAAGDTVIVDLNDCKLRGRPLRRVVEQFGRPTFMLRTHSWAQSYPILYEAEDPKDLSLVGDGAFLHDFAEAAAELQPTYAVPFANMVAFLHPQAWPANDHLITPDRVQAHCAADPRLDAVEVVAMGPGDTWASDTGFDLSPTPWWSDRPGTLARLAAAAAPALERTAAEERERTCSFADLRAYLEDFASSIPAPARRLFFTRPVVFAAPWDEACPWWVLDLRRARFTRVAVLPDARAGIIRIDAAVLGDAIDKRVLHVVHGSMRIRTELRTGGVSDDLGFWALLMVYEIGYLPVGALRWRRFLPALARRWREAVDAVITVVGRGKGTPLERLSGGFASVELDAVRSDSGR